MLRRGKGYRYRIHHPMSLGDALAALFRREPKQAGARTARLGVEQRPKPIRADAPELSLPSEELDDANAAQLHEVSAR